MKLIIGSGITGLLARHIFGEKYEFITQKRSRYYSFDPVLAENYVIRHDKLDDFIKTISPMALHGLREYKRPFSLAGQLMHNESELVVDPYLSKVYGGDLPDTANRHMKTSFWVYNTTAKVLHDTLLEKYSDEIIKSQSEVISINMKDKTIDVLYNEAERKTIEYETIISTVPLDIMLGWAGSTADIKSNSICYYHIRTDKVDVEGADEVLVSDSNIDFFRVTPVSTPFKSGFILEKKNVDWLFWCLDHIDNPHNYFGAFFGYNLDIVDASRIASAIPVGNPPDLGEFENNGIYCVGSNAQWDDFMDVASCINRLIKFRESI